MQRKKESIFLCDIFYSSFLVPLFFLFAKRPRNKIPYFCQPHHLHENFILEKVSPLSSFFERKNPIPLERNNKNMDFSAINNNNTNNNNARPRSSSGIGGAGNHNNMITTTTRNRQISNVYGQGYQHDFARHNRSGATPPSFLHQQQRTRPSSAGLNLFGTLD